MYDDADAIAYLEDENKLLKEARDDLLEEIDRLNNENREFRIKKEVKK